MGTTITLTAGPSMVVITGDRPFEGCTYEKLEGWYGVDGVDLGFVRRPNAAGAFSPSQTFPDQKAISIEGKYFGPDRATSLAMRESLAALYNEGRPVTISVADDLRVTTREVMIESITFPWTIHPDFDFAIDMSAADPRRYGLAAVVSTGLEAPGSGLQLPFDEANGIGLALPSNEAAGLGIDFGTTGVDGRVSVSNTGNADTISTYVVSADLSSSMPDGFALVNVATGERLTYIGPVTSGTTVVLDTRTRTAFINGTAPAGRFLTSPQWWTVPRGTTLQIAFLARGPVSGSPRLDVTTAPGFY